MRRVYNTYTCVEEIKLWLDFEHVPVPGGLSPTELEELNRDRSTCVTRFSYYAREAPASSTTSAPKLPKTRDYAMTILNQCHSVT